LHSGTFVCLFVCLSRSTRSSLTSTLLQGYYSGADHADPNTIKKTITAASATALALARVYVFN